MASTATAGAGLGLGQLFSVAPRECPGGAPPTPRSGCLEGTEVALGQLDSREQESVPAGAIQAQSKWLQNVSDLLKQRLGEK